MEDLPFDIRVYDKNFNFKAFVGDPITLTVTPRFNDTGTGAMAVETSHHAVPHLLADGARIVIKLRGTFLMSGKITRREAEGPNVDGIVTVYFKDDFRLLHQVLGWPVPNAALTAQTSEYAVYSGNAESVVKAAVTANMTTRLGLPVTCAVNANRGLVVPTVRMRFHPLYEKLLPAVEQAGLGITFQQIGAGIVCDVYDPPVYARTLTEQNGIITGWSWSDEDPTATRVVAGGTGDAAARVFRDVKNLTLEAAHRDVFEVFRDARDADSAALLTERAQETLTEGTPRAGFSVTLSESPHFQYGQDGLVVGAQVTVAIGVATRTDILREVTLTYSRDEGLVAVPTIGDVTSSPDRSIANFLARMKKGVTDLKVSK
ncbi:MAG TPA: hypothetical protein VF885_00330 [Arthrobacter sp.]